VKNSGTQIESNQAMNEIDPIIKALGDREIVSVNYDAVECRMQIAALGLTQPTGKRDCLLYGRDREAMYLFVCQKDPDDPGADFEFIGFRFDIAQYQHNPLERVLGMGEAWALFGCAVMELAGFDFSNCVRDTGDPSLN
jgi:hypothetical protein